MSTRPSAAASIATTASAHPPTLSHSRPHPPAHHAQLPCLQRITLPDPCSIRVQDPMVLLCSLGGGEDYFSHKSGKYVDLHDNNATVFTANGSYSATLFANKYRPPRHMLLSCTPTEFRGGAQDYRCHRVARRGRCRLASLHLLGLPEHPLPDPGAGGMGHAVRVDQAAGQAHHGGHGDRTIRYATALCT